jgi:hypothetical protein
MMDKNKKIIIICLIIVLGLCFLVLYPLIASGIFSMEIKLRRPSFYKPLARDMAILMSHMKARDEDEIIYSQEIGDSWYPESLKNAHPNRIFIVSEGMTIS